MNLGRRLFLKGAAASAGAICLGASDTGMPRLRFGVLSDIHLKKPGSETAFIKALGWFRDRGVDGVVIAGDLADHGLADELRLVADAWYKVFPNDKAPDGRTVTKIFQYGNHDVEGFTYGQTTKESRDKAYAVSVVKDRKAAWEACFNEAWEPIYTKVVKGYTFIGAHWGTWKGIPGVKDAVAAAVRKADPALPFFYAQHPHPKGTCYGPWAWGHDDGSATAALSPFPNAVAFSGHSHYSLTDERSIWQGAFTSIGTSSLSYVATPYGRENGHVERDAEALQMKLFNAPQGKQGQLISVFDDRIAVERHEFVFDESLGPDWVFPIPGKNQTSRTYTFGARAAKAPVPSFAPGSKVSVSAPTMGHNRTGKDVNQLIVTFPSAAADGGRVFDYEVTARYEVCDVIQTFRSKRVFPASFHLGAKRAAADKIVTCVFALSEVPGNTAFSFEVTPLNSFGVRGAPIRSSAKVFALPPPPKTEKAVKNAGTKKA